jgi:hypothetical protein
MSDLMIGDQYERKKYGATGDNGIAGLPELRQRAV